MVWLEMITSLVRQAATPFWVGKATINCTVRRETTSSMAGMATTTCRVDWAAMLYLAAQGTIACSAIRPTRLMTQATMCCMGAQGMTVCLAGMETICISLDAEMDSTDPIRVVATVSGLGSLAAAGILIYLHRGRSHRYPSRAPSAAAVRLLLS